MQCSSRLTTTKKGGFHMTNAEENRKILKGSLDYTICKRTVFVSGIVIVAMTMVLFLLSWAVQSFRLMLILIPVALFCIPVLRVP